MACPMSTVIGGSFEQFNRKGSKRPTYPVTVASCQQTNASTAPTAPALSLPPWFDQARFDQARSILSDHFMSIFLCHLSGLVLLVFIKSIYATLALSGKSRDLVSIFYRYLHTLMHVKLWYEGRVYEATDDAHHSLLRVVGMHRSVAELQNRHRKEGEDRLALSQRDMALTQVSAFCRDDLKCSKLIELYSFSSPSSASSSSTRRKWASRLMRKPSVG